MKVLDKQDWHFLALACLIALAAWLSDLPGMEAGSLLGMDTPFWFWLSVFVAVAHQIYVWLAWRLQLTRQVWTRRFGLEGGFRIYAALFAILILFRPLVIVLLAISNRDLLPVASTLLIFIALLFSLPSGYLGYSVMRYFTIRRAFGIDHFDPAARSLPIETRGIYRFTRNGMYTYGFLVLYLPGLLLASPAALLAAAFQHAYVWVHYFTVEKPDMDVIYGG